jgi:Flp pilus assembly protein TadD
VKDEDKDFLELLGYLYLQYGKHDPARVIYHTLCELSDPTDIMLLTYAYCLAADGSYAMALHEMDKISTEVLNLQELSGYHLLRGNIFWHMRRDREARAELRRFLELEQLRTHGQPRPAVIGQHIRPLVVDGVERVVSINVRPPDEGLWKKFLRFIARKDLNRELSR